MDNKGMVYTTQPHGLNQPPGYPQATGEPNVQTIVVQSPVRWSWCPLITTLFAVLFCPLCGIPGMAAAILSYTDHKQKEYERAANKKRVALGCGITGVVLGVIWIIAAIGANVATILALQNSNNNYYVGK